MERRGFTHRSLKKLGVLSNYFFQPIVLDNGVSCACYIHLCALNLEIQ